MRCICQTSFRSTARGHSEHTNKPRPFAGGGGRNRSIVFRNFVPANIKPKQSGLPSKQSGLPSKQSGLPSKQSGLPNIKMDWLKGTSPKFHDKWVKRQPRP